jgi:hypothetical protein
MAAINHARVAKGVAIGGAIFAAIFGAMMIAGDRHAPADKAGYIGLDAGVTNPIDKLKVVRFAWRKGGYGTILMVDLTIQNDNAAALKDVAVHCDGYAESGTRIGSNDRIIYQIFPGQEQRSVPDFDMGFVDPQVADEACAVTGAEKFGQ